MKVNKAKGFIEVDHTADLAIKIWATTLNDLFKLAVEGMNSLTEFVVDENDPGQYEDFCIEDIDLESMLVSLLNECNYKIQQDHIQSEVLEIRVENKKISGVFFNQKIKSFDMEIKAVTYHNLKIKHSKTGYAVDIVFDV